MCNPTGGHGVGPDRRLEEAQRERGVVDTPLFASWNSYFTCSREMYSISASTRERTYRAGSYWNSP